MSGYSLAGTALGLALTIVYLMRARRSARLESALGLMLGATGMAGTIKLVVVCLTAQMLEPFGPEDRGYILVGAFALGWVSTRTVLGILTAPAAAGRG